MCPFVITSAALSTVGVFQPVWCSDLPSVSIWLGRAFNAIRMTLGLEEAWEKLLGVFSLGGKNTIFNLVQTGSQTIQKSFCKTALHYAATYIELAHLRLLRATLHNNRSTMRKCSGSLQSPLICSWFCFSSVDGASFCMGL